MPDLMDIGAHSTLQVAQRYPKTKADAAQRAGSIQSAFYTDPRVTPPLAPERVETATCGGGTKKATRSRSLQMAFVAPTGVDPVTFRFSVMF